MKDSGLSQEEIENEKRDILAELEYRKKNNPLSFHTLLPMQEEFKRDPAKFKCIFGGNRSGKTECVADCVVDESLENPKLKIWVLRFFRSNRKC